MKGVEKLDRAARLDADARWLLRFVKDNVGDTGWDWEKIHRAENHLKDCLAVRASLTQDDPDA